MMRAAKELGTFIKIAKTTRVERLVATLEKAAQLPQFGTMPLSSHTAIADYIKNKKYKPEQNEDTKAEQETLDKLLAGMSRSRARVVGAHRRGRQAPQELLKGHFQAAGLWS